jgi:BASS family bile acid:Na+ symporter
VTLDTAVRLTLLASIWLIVLSLGASSSTQGALYVLRRPAILLRALAALFVAAPAFALLLAAVVPMRPPIRFAVVAMSFAPVPPILPYKQMKAGGGGEYTIGLLVAAAVVAVVATPFLVNVADALLGSEALVTPGRVARTVLISVGLPLAVGMLVGALFKTAAGAIARYARLTGMLLLLVAFAAMLVAAWREMFMLVGDGSLLVIAVTVALSLAAGHLLSGGREGGALALAAATRHPGVALAIAAMSYPGQSKLITAAILLYLIVTMLVTWPYVRWISGRAQHDAHGVPDRV